MRLDNQYEFSKDTIASINTSGLLGEVYIGLDAGGDPKMLAEGDRITKPQSAVVIEKLISQFLFEKAQESPAGKDPAVAAPAQPAPALAGKATQGAKK